MKNNTEKELQAVSDRKRIDRALFKLSEACALLESCELVTFDEETTTLETMSILLVKTKHEIQSLYMQNFQLLRARKT